MKIYKAAPESAGLRADIFVAAKYPQFARSSLKGLFSTNAVRVNNKPAKPGYKIKAGDVIGVDSAVLDTQPKPIDLPILYEDSNVVVIDKPAGVLTHAKGALNLEPSVASFLREKITDDQLSGNRAGIVHRLDRATSGVIICAKNATAQKWLQSQFSKRQAKKTYIAIVEGCVQPKAAIIDAPIGRNPKKPQTFIVTAAGKPAQTEYKTDRIINKKGRLFSSLILKPLTGRTHQLRVHLAYTGHPIVGDAVYGEPGDNLYLHARSLELILPGGSRHFFSAPIPGIFKDF